MSDLKSKADEYIALRAHIADLAAQARELAREFPMGRTEGTYRDIRVAMTSGGYRHYREKPARRVSIVDKLKPKKEKVKK